VIGYQLLIGQNFTSSAACTRGGKITDGRRQ